MDKYSRAPSGKKKSHSTSQSGMSSTNPYTPIAKAMERVFAAIDSANRSFPDVVDLGAMRQELAEIEERLLLLERVQRMAKLG